MGQTSSGAERVPEWAEVQRHAASLKELAFLSYESFASSLKELNKISQTFTDSNGKRLVFAVKRGTDATMLWKATIKIGCVRINATTKQIESYRLLNLKQYLQVYRMIMSQVDAQNQSASTHQQTVSKTPQTTSSSPCTPKSDTSSGDSCDTKGPELKMAFASSRPYLSSLTTSMILDKVTEVTGNVDQNECLDECCICMERKPEVILPCAHSYCVPCIEQWNVTNNTCPVCREEIESTNDSWVISEAPDSSEMAAEVQKLLSGLADKLDET